MEIDAEKIRKSLRAQLKNGNLISEFLSFDTSSPFDVIANRKQIVLYGYGKIGKVLAKDVKNCFGYRFVAVCDNGSTEKEFCGRSILKHDDCLKSYPDATYIISVQRGYLGIAAKLLEDGINPEKILFFDSRRKKIEGDFRKSVMTSSLYSRLGASDKLIVYGMGRVGKSVLSDLKGFNDVNITAICDNGFPADVYDSIKVYTHSTCIEKYKDSKYLVTPQNGFLPIIFALLKDGVKKENIYFFDNIRKRVEELI